jgi:hemoglobin-like flavoprotein
MHMIGLAVRGLDNLNQLIPAVEDLGRRHGNYGVRDEHYKTVGGALLWTLERGLGEHFTQDVREAWIAVYEVLALTMQRGARHAAARA